MESAASRRTMAHMPSQLTRRDGSATRVSFVDMRLHHHMFAAGRGKICPLEAAVVQILRLRGEARDLAVRDDRDRAAETLDLLEIVRGKEDRLARAIEFF